MTVTVRPIPARAWGNAVRPFQAIRPSNNIRPYTLKTWRPPVPEPLPPAPLLGIPTLLAIGALVLSQIWGLFGGRPPGQAEGERPLYFNPSPSTATLRVVCDVFYDYVGGSDQAPNFSYPGTHFIGSGESYTLPEDSYTYIVNSPDGPWDEVPQEVIRITVYGVNGQETISPAINSTPFAFQTKVPGTYRQPSPTSTYFYRWTARILDGSEAGADPVAVPVRPPAELGQVPFSGAYLPPALTEADQRPLPVLVPEAGLQIAEVGPGISAPPAVAPAQARPPAPLRVPAAVSLTNAGELAPPAPAAVPVTDPEAHYPVPGAPPVTGGGTRSTPAAMAQELGRMEQKVARLLNPGPGLGGDGTDRLQLLLELAGRLLELLTSLSAGGSYVISSPCELDPEGNRIVTEVPYSGSLSAIGVIGNKVDALADLLQAHKDLKQPICRPAPAAGQPVTVQFEQVE